MRSLNSPVPASCGLSCDASAASSLLVPNDPRAGVAYLQHSSNDLSGNSSGPGLSQAWDKASTKRRRAMFLGEAFVAVRIRCSNRSFVLQVRRLKDSCMWWNSAGGWTLRSRRAQYQACRPRLLGEITTQDLAQVAWASVDDTDEESLAAPAPYCGMDCALVSEWLGLINKG